MIESWTEVWRAVGAHPGDRVYFAFSFGPFIGFWLAFESATRLGCLGLPGGGLSSIARLRAILDNGASLLCCTPTYALRLAEVAAEEGISLRESKVRALIVAGEPGGSIPAVRAQLEKLWPGAQVRDHHGLTETGPVSYECPARPGVLHVIESAYYPEVVVPATGQPAPPGEPGELVLTTLGRMGSPLLRYRTGDLVRSAVSNPESGSICACGRAELALEGGILGRTDDMVVVRGVNVYPRAVEQLVRSRAEVAEYLVEITSERGLTELKLQIEPRSDCADPARLARALQNEFEAALALRVAITVVPSGSLPRFEMKARRWVRK
jgi:phenylacetate-CoA ligase